MRELRELREHEADCASCSSGARCWGERPAAGAGFLVRRARPLGAGEILLNEGDAFAGPYVVTSGCLCLTQVLDDGAERIVGFRVPGELVGLESCGRRAHRFGARAVRSATVCRLRWSAGGLHGRGAALLRTLLAKAAEQLENGAPPWAGLSARERVRAFVQDFERRTDQPLPMTRAEIGSYLGLAEETVVRAFAELRRDAARGA